MKKLLLILLVFTTTCFAGVGDGSGAIPSKNKGSDYKLFCIKSNSDGTGKSTDDGTGKPTKSCYIVFIKSSSDGTGKPTK